MMMKITRVGRKRRDQPPVWLEQAGRPPWRLGVPQTAREATRGGREEGTKERRNEGTKGGRKRRRGASPLPLCSALRARCFPSRLLLLVCAPPNLSVLPGSSRPGTLPPPTTRPPIKSPLPPACSSRLEFDRPRGNGKRLAQPPRLSLLSRHASLKLELSSSGTPRCLRRPPLRRGFAPRSNPQNSSFPRIHRVVSPVPPAATVPTTTTYPIPYLPARIRCLIRRKLRVFASRNFADSRD